MKSWKHLYIKFQDRLFLIRLFLLLPGIFTFWTVYIRASTEGTYEYPVYISLTMGCLYLCSYIVLQFFPKSVSLANYVLYLIGSLVAIWHTHNLYLNPFHPIVSFYLGFCVFAVGGLGLCFTHTKIYYCFVFFLVLVLLVTANAPMAVKINFSLNFFIFSFLSLVLIFNIQKGKKKYEDLLIKHQLLNEEITNSEKHLSVAQKIGKIGSWEFDVASHKIFWSQETYKIYNLPLSFKPTLEKIWDFYDTSSQAKLKEHLTECIEKGTPYDIELKCKFSLGQNKWVRAIGSREVLFDGNIKLTGICQDISHQKKVERELIYAKELAEISSRAESQFLATMSHEIRTPMNAIISIAHHLKEEINEKKPYDCSLDIKDNIQTLYFSAQHLLSLINDILDYSKIENGKITLESSPINLKLLIDNVYKAFYPLAREKGIHLRKLIDPSISPFLLGDGVRLNQILVNLIGNAIKFTEKGEVAIDIRTISQIDKTERISFKIEDTGIGISSELQEDIFSEFTQVHSAFNRKYEGTGLGLAITKRLLELHNSHIHLKSELGKGSSFKFELAFPIAGKDDFPSISSEDSNFMNHFQLKKILLVEDNAVNAKVATKFLDKWKVSYDVAKNGKIAVEMVKENHYDLILMDIQMPVMDGFKATETIRGMSIHHLKEIPIIALTANCSKEAQDKATESGMNDFISKPFNPGKLQKILELYLVPINPL